MDIKKILKDNNCRITKERIMIYEFFKGKHLLNATDLLEGLKDIGRASIFRTLNLFVELGIIRKINLGENTYHYELCEDEHHHEHMKCIKCNKVINFNSNDICSKIFNTASQMGFDIKEHQIFILGRCNNCK